MPPGYLQPLADSLFDARADAWHATGFREALVRVFQTSALSIE